jgi:uroporphyrinogen decarboxylase
MEEMTPRDRLLATVAFEPVDRPVHNEAIGFWPETLSRWNGEGLPPEINEEVSAYIYFGYDLQLPLSIGAHEHPGFDPVFGEEIIERDEHFTVKRDMAGSIVRVMTDGMSTIPAWLSSPVSDRESWEKVKERLDPETPGRLSLLQPMIDLVGEQPWPLCVYIPGLFGTHRHLLGFEPLMIAYRRQPELLHEIARHWVFLWRRVVEKACEVRRPDVVSLWEDMCYRNGPMISPRAFDEFMSPYYRELIGALRSELEVPVVGVDTDGDLTLLIPKFVDAGVNLICPWEVQAGMDVLEVRNAWPREFAIWGGMDKRKLALDEQAIRDEVMRVVPPMLEWRGYIPAIDHSVPPDVPLVNWRYFLDLARGLGEGTVT